MQGWIKLHRCLLDSTTFDNDKLLKIWVWCLLKATHKEHTQIIGKQIVLLEPGQFVYGRKKAAEELNYSETTVREYMKILVETKNVTIKPTNKYSVVTVSQWAFYQSEEEETTNRATNKKPTKSQQKATNNNVKNGKNEKKIYMEFVQLTEDEHQKLVDQFGEPRTNDFIERLNNYVGSTGKKYKSHYHTILNWSKKDKPVEPKLKPKEDLNITW